MNKTVVVAAVFGLSSVNVAAGVDARSHSPLVYLAPLGTYQGNGAEIAAYDAVSQRLFVTDAGGNAIEIIDLSKPKQLASLGVIDLSAYGAGPNSVAVKHGVVAVAMEADPKTDPGSGVCLDVEGKYLNQLTVGALPDMLTYSRNGKYLLVANEGEPNDDYTVDPEGSVSIINLKGGVKKLTQDDVTTAGFIDFNDANLPGVRIFGPNASVAQDLEPEYIAISRNSKTAFVTLQENNALAIVDIASSTVTDVISLGTKDHSLVGNALDASNRDGGINIRYWPVQGLYQPDAIAAYKVKGKTFLVTANEGDARDYDGYSEETRVKDLVLDSVAFPDADVLQENENLGRSKTTAASGDINNDGFQDVGLHGGDANQSHDQQNQQADYEGGAPLSMLQRCRLFAHFSNYSA